MAGSSRYVSPSLLYLAGAAAESMHWMEIVLSNGITQDLA